MRPNRPARSRQSHDQPAPRQESPVRLNLAGPPRAVPHKAQEILDGLLAPAAHVSPKYFYDRLGSLIFEAITALPEYYLTRTELALLRTHAADIREHAGRSLPIVDLGAGSCTKAPLLFEAMESRQYVAIDISGEHLLDALDRLHHRWPHMAFTAAMADLEGDLAADSTLPCPALFTFFGSSIGNYPAAAAETFLSRLAPLCGDGGGLLIGIDLLKDKAILEPAYNDSLGVTAAFNMNILGNLNRIAGTNFATRDWVHVADFEESRACIAMYLEARRDVDLRWPGGRRLFPRGTRLHTEDSCKYSLRAFRELLGRAGFPSTRSWVDPNNWFALIHARP